MARLPETTRIARVLDIVWHINAAPRYWTRKRLAEKFEVSERSITSDLDLIRHRLKFDLENDRGNGYYFAKVPQLPSVSYSIAEALALILAARAARQFPGVPQRDLSLAITRLSSVIPGELRAMVEQVANDGLGESDAHREEVLSRCSQAISASHSLEIVYAAASANGEETRRTIDPYAVFPYDRSWHVVGYCHLRDDVRVFKVDRIRAASQTGAAFERPADFDLEGFLSTGWGLMRGLELPVEEVVLRFRPPASRWVAEERWHESQQVIPLADGSVEFRVTIQVTPEFQRWVFRFGSTVDVIAPASLREWMACEARAVLTSVQATDA
ncbi:MAG TPA: transcriptional regulator [Thermomicrobiales bacterium]|nr:transcriptional regulator [Thermomicrobiales bacterium]